MQYVEFLPLKHQLLYHAIARALSAVLCTSGSRSSLLDIAIDSD